jgi:HEAT repeat protein
VEALKNSNTTAQRAAADALAFFGSDAVPALVEVLKDSAADAQYSRFFAAHALRGIGPDATAAVHALVDTLKESKGRVRQSAAAALVAIGTDAIPALVETLRNSNGQVQIYAAHTLGGIGPDAMPALLEALDDSNAGVRMAAARGLGNLARGVRVGSDTHALPFLRAAYQALLGHGYIDYTHDLNRVIHHFERVKRRNFFKNVSEWLDQHQTATIVASVFGLCLLWVMWWIIARRLRPH